MFSCNGGWRDTSLPGTSNISYQKFSFLGLFLNSGVSTLPIIQIKNTGVIFCDLLINLSIVVSKFCLTYH